MASPQLQMAIDAYKSLQVSMMGEEGKTPQGCRAAYEKMMGAAHAIAKDIRCEPVNPAGVKAEWIYASIAEPDRVVIYLHGGGFMMGSVNTHRDLMSRLSRAAGARVLGLDYRLAPDYPYPAPLEDTTAAYGWLIAAGIEPSRIAIAGDSAGGGLTVATLVNLRDSGAPLPGAGVCLSPWVDLEAIGETITTKAAVDPIVAREILLMMAKLYLGDRDLRTPLAAPLYADLRGLPPILIQVGSAETLLSDSERLAQRAEAAGVQVVLQVWDDMIHVWQGFASFLPEGQQAIDAIGSFVHEHTRG